jgi:hypothetical protein
VYVAKQEQPSSAVNLTEIDAEIKVLQSDVIKMRTTVADARRGTKIAHISCKYAMSNSISAVCLEI